MQFGERNGVKKTVNLRFSVLLHYNDLVRDLQHSFYSEDFDISKIDLPVAQMKYESIFLKKLRRHPGIAARFIFHLFLNARGFFAFPITRSLSLCVPHPFVS